MARYLVGTDGIDTSEVLCEFLRTRVREGDYVCAVHSYHTSPDRDGAADRASLASVDDALAIFERLGETVTVDVRQVVNEADPADDLLRLADREDANEIVVGLREHGLAERLVSGSTLQSVLKRSTRPVVAVPLRE